MNPILGTVVFICWLFGTVAMMLKALDYAIWGSLDRRNEKREQRKAMLWAALAYTSFFVGLFVTLQMMENL